MSSTKTAAAAEERAPEGDAAGAPPSPATVGARLQRLRRGQGLSVREVAERAEVDKNTVVRLEKGLPTSGRTLDRVCRALGIYVSRVLLPEPDEGQTVVLHRRCEEAWWPYPGMGEPFPGGGKDAETRDDGESAAEDARGLVASLACRMPRGRLRSSLLRLRDETTPNSHPGEELVFCLRGPAHLTVAGRVHRLDSGDAASFWSAEEHTYAPAVDIPDGDPPALLFTVWIDTRDDHK